MSRSNPTDQTPHPCNRWFDWNGEAGNLQYYDKTLKARVDVDLPFSFIPLDRLATIKGWNEQTKSGIYSNEVRDTRAEPFVVKSFKGGIIAEGFYADIKDKTKSVGGHFTLVQYMAFRDSQEDLIIGSVSFKGAALSTWMEFEKAHRNELETSKGVEITDISTSKKGSIVFKTPVFQILDLTAEENSEAIRLDKILQHYFRNYFKRDRTEQAVPIEPKTEDTDPSIGGMPSEDEINRQTVTAGNIDEEIPF